MNPYVVAVDASNPAEYLAVCGLIELAGQRNRAVTASWTRRQGLVMEAKSAPCDVCEIHAAIPESTFAKEIATLLGHRDAWRAITDSGRVALSDAVGKWTGGIELLGSDGSIISVIDHWYEWAFVKDGRVIQKLKKRDGKGRWKFWAGQQDSKKGIAGLLLDLINGAEPISILNPQQLQTLFAYSRNGRSPLKLDASTTRSSIDRGISANDAADEGKTFVRPILELLAVIGLSAFFPPRRIGGNAPEGTVGIHARRFRYCTWNPRAPLTLARLLARGVRIAGFEISRYDSPIGGKEYSYLRYARPGGLAESAGVSAYLDDEDTDE